MVGTCANPDCTANGTKRCAGCLQTSYCGSTCQKQDWKHHKPACKSSSAKVVPKQCSNPGCAARPDQITMPCTRCNGATYCSSLCQEEDWEEHKASCRDRILGSNNGAVARAVMIHSQADGAMRYSKFEIPREHVIFNTSPVPISQKIGFPLLMLRPSKGSERGPLGDNQHAAWLMIDPVTGLAPTEWQGRVGNVIVARPDGEPLDTATLGAITDYISDILDAFGDEVGVARKYYNRGQLDKFIADHLKMQEEFKAFQETQARG